MRIRIQNPQCLLWFRYLILKVAKCTVDTGSCRFESGFVQIRKWVHADSKVGSCKFESACRFRADPVLRIHTRHRDAEKNKKVSNISEK